MVSRFCATPHGSIVMGIGDPNELKGFHFHSSWEFLDEMSRHVVRFLPPLKDVRVVRQWAGLYDITPDSQPILGPTPKVYGFLTAWASVVMVSCSDPL
ncbi:MAG: FAD-dependent oxidoreductase [Bacillota bacterium]